MKRMQVHISSDPVMIVDRGVLKKSKLVYVLVVPKGIKYTNGRSKIVYVGMTKRGVSRVASSAAYRSHVLNEHGIRRFEVYTASCSAKPGSKGWWTYLEQALLARFREKVLSVAQAQQTGPKAPLYKGSGRTVQFEGGR